MSDLTALAVASYSNRAQDSAYLKNHYAVNYSSGEQSRIVESMNRLDALRAS